MNNSTKAGIITIVLIIVGFIGWKVLALNSISKQEVVDNDAKFLSNWNKAGVKKLEEKNKKEQAEKLLKEAEAARIEKEQLLGLQGSGFTK